MPGLQLFPPLSRTMPVGLLACVVKLGARFFCPLATMVLPFSSGGVGEWPIWPLTLAPLACVGWPLPLAGAGLPWLWRGGMLVSGYPHVVGVPGNRGGTTGARRPQRCAKWPIWPLGTSTQAA
jgi:hypothetical protein